MTSELNLSHGDPDRAARIQERQEAGSSRSKTRRGTSKSESGGKSSGGSKGSTAARNIKSDLKDAFNRLGDLRLAKDDEELGTALKEEAESMAQGLVSATRALPFLQGPILFFLAILVPTLAFWRVGSILFGRAVERRARIEAERQAATATGTEPVPPAYTA